MEKIFSVFLAFGAALSASANTLVKTEHLQAELVFRSGEWKSGARNEVGLYFRLRPEWHIYWKNPGDSGERPRFDWQFPARGKAEEILWPAPTRIVLKPLANYGYEKEILLGTSLSEFGDGIVTLRARWLVCKEECVPEEGTFSFDPRRIPARQVQPNLFSKRDTQIPRRIDGVSFWREKEEKSRLSLRFALPGEFQVKGASFFPEQEAVFEAGEEQRFTSHGIHEFSLSLSRTPQKLPSSLTGLLRLEAAEEAVFIEVAESSSTASAPAPVESYAWLLIFALAGGVLLNLMPCVFPILAIKASSLLRSGNEDQSLRRKEAWAFGGGVLCSFWALALGLEFLKRIGYQAGWGFQLQSPYFVYALVLLFVLMAFHFWGFLNWGEGLANQAGRVRVSQNLVGSFLSGVLATIVSTPCTAPFMGTALGATLALSPLKSFGIFTLLGFGMALPYMLLAVSPGLARMLPRPGAWMETLKKFLAFPLLATAVWLLWVLGQQAGLDFIVRVLFSLILLSFALWCVGLAQKGGTRKKWLSVACLSLVAGAWISAPTSERLQSAGEAALHEGELPWEEYSPEKVKELQAEGRLVYVDFTAAWCLSCQVNKRVVFGSDEVREFFKKERVAMLRADWTKYDPKITVILKSFGRSGVPLNLVYGPKASEAELLPPLLSPDVVLKALRKHL